MQDLSLPPSSHLSSGPPELREESPNDPALLVGTHETPTVEPPRAGIDYLRISTPVAGKPVRLDLWDTIAGGRFETWIPVGATKVRLSCSRAPDGRLWAGASFNPSRILSQDPLFLCSVGDLPAALAHVWPELTLRSDPVDPAWLHATIRRIDLARDFEVGDPTRVLEALLRVPRTRAKQLYAFYDPARTVITSITMRTSQGGRVGGNRTGQKVTIYDKGAQLGRSDLKRLRWEARCQDWAQRVGKITLVRDLTGDSAVRLMLDRWAWSRAGAAMGSTSTIVDSVIAMGLSATDTRTLVGDVTIRGAGRDVPVVDGTRTRREARLRELDQVFSDANPYPLGSRLDLVLGREVPVVARSGGRDTAALNGRQRRSERSSDQAKNI